LSAPKLTPLELLTLTGFQLGAIVAHASFRSAWGDGLFLGALLTLLAVLGARTLVREDIPPPGFFLVAAGLLAALAGTTLHLCSNFLELSLPVRRFAELLLQQGFLLLPILGVGGFLLPRFYGVKSRHHFDGSYTPPPGWRRRAALASGYGALVIAGLAIEAAGAVRLGALLRVVAVVAFVMLELPLKAMVTRRGALARNLTLSLLLIAGGYAALAIWPERVLTMEHVVFMCGFALLTLVVATRVMLGHSGTEHLFGARLVMFWVASLSIVLGLTSRVAADFLPEHLISHYGYAALMWAVGVLVWLIFVLPKAFRAEPD
ncbi:MAG: NnrS family protein, partial [Opitutales bacterium]